MGNVDVKAADRFVAALGVAEKKKMKKGECLEYIRKELLAETAKYLEPMNLTPETAPGGGEAGGWISFVGASPPHCRGDWTRKGSRRRQRQCLDV